MPRRWPPTVVCARWASRSSTLSSIGMTLEDTTGIDTLRTIDSDGTERVYDLSGRLVGSDAKGIVISNGKKYVK